MAIFPPIKDITLTHNAEGIQIVQTPVSERHNMMYRIRLLGIPRADGTMNERYCGRCMYQFFRYAFYDNTSTQGSWMCEACGYEGLRGSQYLTIARLRYIPDAEHNAVRQDIQSMRAASRILRGAGQSAGPFYQIGGIDAAFNALNNVNVNVEVPPAQPYPEIQWDSFEVVHDPLIALVDEADHEDARYARDEGDDEAEMDLEYDQENDDDEDPGENDDDPDDEL